MRRILGGGRTIIHLFGVSCPEENLLLSFCSFMFCPLALKAFAHKVYILCVKPKGDIDGNHIVFTLSSNTPVSDVGCENVL